LLMQAGVDDKPTVFLFSDTQIVTESFVEDINGILNTGEVPNLFNTEEKMQIMDSLGSLANEAGLSGESEVYSYFISRVRHNLHIVLAFSPIGSAFRTRLRMFPSLVNCCTINWFTAWPQQALRSVADTFLANVDLELKTKKGVIEVCVLMQRTVREMSADMLSSLNRYYYVTPTSYLELINTFKNILSKQRLEVMETKTRYDNGLSKLAETENQVGGMKQELIALQPKLKEATVATDALIVQVKESQVKANEQKSMVEKEEAVCNEHAQEAGELKASCERDLAEALPALDSAIKALKTLSKSDIVEVKAMKKPPAGVKLTMEAVCHMMNVRPRKIPDPNGGNKKVDDYWEPAQKQLLSDPRFLNHLFEYDKDNIPAETVAKITPYVTLDTFRPEVVKKASVAAAGLCKWVHAMYVYDKTAKVVGPKKASLKKAIQTLEEAQGQLKEKQAQLKEVEDALAALQAQLQGAVDKKENLAVQVEDCKNKLTRAEQLINGLGGEKARWSQLSIDLQNTYENVTGDIMLSSGVIAYLGAFPKNYRDQACADWKKALAERNITCDENFSLTSTLGEPVEIRSWTINKLPNDSLSVDNAIMLFKSNRWPLMIDPQGQANRWIKNLEGSRSLKVVKQNQASFVRTIENAIQFGHPVLLENVPEAIDPVLESVLLKQIVTVGGISTIRLGDNTVEYDPAFKLYITTKLSSPHYPPETCVKVNLLNFMATEDGLQDQMQGIVVKVEEPVLEAKREQLVVDDAQNKKQLKEIEDMILRLLKEATGNILEDDQLIATLTSSKETSNNIEQKVKEAQKTNVQIQATREAYTPVAFRVSQLFFCIADLAAVDPMYQYSLEWFTDLFTRSIAKAEKSHVLEERLGHLNASFTYELYKNVCRSLFEKDKLLFSFLLCIKVLLGEGKLDGAELRFFLTGNTSMDLERPNPIPGKWLTDASWGDILGMSKMPGFKGFDRYFEKHLSGFEDVYNSNQAAQDLKALLKDAYSDFQSMIVLRAVRADCVVPEIQSFVSNNLGQKFIEPPPFDLEASYNDSTCATPLIFVLSPGADPMSELLKLAEKLNMDKKLKAISLGQGQGQLAETTVEVGEDKGTWVCLQNCHLFVSWMPVLERLCEEITPERVHTNFRLWLSSEPSKAFPVFVLQNGVKMVNEPPKGIRASLFGTYSSMNDEYFESCTRTKEFKKVLFGLCFLHAIVIERRKFGPQGWNIQYVFSKPDLNISRDQLRIFLNDLPPGGEVPYAALAYLVGECNYGGRVTDDKDRRCINNILSDFYTPDIQDDNYKFSPSGAYYAPKDGTHADYVEYIRGLPFTDAPEVFGLHDNANITSAIGETNKLLGTALSLQPKTSGGEGLSWDETLANLSSDIEARLPALFDTEKAFIEFPVLYEESMNTVLTQELLRFNKLAMRLKSTLASVQKAIKGLVVMSAELEGMGNSMVNGQVPKLWAAVAYPSLKPLGSWVNDLLARLEFLQDWMDSGKPPAKYWISGFFFTQAFITGTKQNFARKHGHPIDQVDFDFAVLTPEEEGRANRRPDDGAYIYGMFADGARWDADDHCLAESKPKELFTAIPMIWLKINQTKLIPGVEGTDPGGTAHVYICPCYKTSVRFGVLSTTGHSTNFVIMVRLPMAPEHHQKHWIKRGMAMLTQLDT